jgi:hypothetical protein
MGRNVAGDPRWGRLNELPEDVKGIIKCCVALEINLEIHCKIFSRKEQES